MISKSHSDENGDITLGFCYLSSTHRKLFLPYLSMTINTQNQGGVHLGRHPFHQWNKCLDDSHPYKLIHFGAECVTSLFSAAGSGRYHSLCKSTFHRPLLLPHSPAPQLAVSSEEEICYMTNKSGPILLFHGLSSSPLSHHNCCNSSASAKASVKLE